ncbi:hypothetical protein PIB30_013555 [Stylosanthes scabra]|uniref:Uncharacterized protein n=1 Tax=Stylosanthes scabra TaxID=79078 RepID=A0ABU6S738_9FABA|nr:hypothetical protein [Stylosanthes scabra]
MALSLTRFSWNLWGGKEKEPVCNNGSSVNSPISSSEMVKFHLMKETKMEPPTTQRRVRRKWQRREERRRRRVDRDEYKDVVLVPSDGSDSDYDYDSDWSIGWLEPHGSDFQSSDVVDDDDSFAVLVPCYKHGCKEVEEASNNVLLTAIQNLSYEFSSTGKNYMEHWLACLQNFEA